MYNYVVGDVWDWVNLGVKYGVCLGEMLTFDVNFR